jgi:hypothetical protein
VPSCGDTGRETLFAKFVSIRFPDGNATQEPAGVTAPTNKSRRQNRPKVAEIATRGKDGSWCGLKCRGYYVASFVMCYGVFIERCGGLRLPVTSNCGPGAANALRLLRGFDALQLFAGFEADGFAGRDADLFAGARIAADAGFTGLDAEDAEAAELDALAAAESLFQGFENGFDSLLGFGAADERFGHNRIHDVQLNHTCLPRLWQMLEGAP